jgi:hypothetical protein
MSDSSVDVHSAWMVAFLLDLFSISGRLIQVVNCNAVGHSCSIQVLSRSLCFIFYGPLSHESIQFGFL